MASQIDADVEAVTTTAPFSEVHGADLEKSFFDPFVDREVMTAIDALPDAFRDVVVLSDLEGLSYTELREVLSVPGGGVALLRMQASLKDLKFDDEDENIGVRIVERALEEPIRQIVQNAGVEGSIVVEKVRNEKNQSFGFNARTEVYEDLVQAGVIDPTKVTRTALQNAASIAGLLLTTEAVVTERPEKDKAAPGGMPGGGMGDMY